MTKKNAQKLAARARQKSLGGKYHHHLRQVGGGQGEGTSPPDLFTGIIEAIRLAFPNADCDLEGKRKQLVVRIAQRVFAFCIPIGAEPTWPVSALADWNPKIGWMTEGAEWECTSTDDVLTVLRWPNARPSHPFASVDEIRDDEENPAKHVWMQVDGDVSRAAFECEGCKARIYVEFGETPEEVALMGFRNWRSLQAGTVSRQRTLTRAMGVAPIPPQCPTVAKLTERTKEVLKIADKALELAAASPEASALAILVAAGDALMRFSQNELTVGRAFAGAELARLHDELEARKDAVHERWRALADLREVAPQRRNRPKNLFIELTGAGPDNALATAILNEYQRVQDAYNAAYGAWIALPEPDETEEPEEPEETAPEGTLLAIARKHGWPGLDDQEWWGT